MQKTISATFWNPDDADLALQRIRERHIPLSVKSFDSAASDPERARTLLYSPYATGQDPRAYGLLPLVTLPPDGRTDHPRTDVLLKLSVAESDCDAVRRQLISSHARQIREWQ